MGIVDIECEEHFCYLLRFYLDFCCVVSEVLECSGELH